MAHVLPSQKCSSNGFCCRKSTFSCDSDAVNVGLTRLSLGSTMLPTRGKVLFTVTGAGLGTDGVFEAQGEQWYRQSSRQPGRRQLAPWRFGFPRCERV